MWQLVVPSAQLQGRPIRSRSTLSIVEIQLDTHLAICVLELLHSPALRSLQEIEIREQFFNAAGRRMSFYVSGILD